jgi:hypothetical protein
VPRAADTTQTTGTATLQFLAILRTPGVPADRATVGALLYGCALGLFWWAVHINAQKPLSAVFSRDLPVPLVTRGPYQLVRHPFYCSYLLTWSAGVVITAQLWLALTVLPSYAIYLSAGSKSGNFQTRLFGWRISIIDPGRAALLPNPIKILPGLVIDRQQAGDRRRPQRRALLACPRAEPRT